MSSATEGAMINTQKSEVEYIPIRIDTISDDEVIDFDLYTLEKNRYFLFCTAFSNFRKGDLSRTYIERTRYLYIKKKHKKNYRRYVEKNLPNILHDNAMETESKVEIIYDVSNSMVVEIFSDTNAMKPERVDNFIGNVMDFMFSEKVKLGELIKFAEHDFYTYNHSLHVFIYTTMFASFLRLTDKKILSSLSQGAFLHDIGKSMVSTEIINKPGPLDESEWKEMQQHPVYGYRIAQDTMKIDDSIIKSIILNHHERLDGKGYPSGNSNISFYDRIVAIADTYDAITSNRAYQMAKNPFETLKYMIQTQSKRLDLDLMQKFAIMLGSK